jgi:predicted dehydrogenase
VSESPRHPQAPVRLAILGCGAVTERLHLPAAARTEGLVVSVLVDRDADRARDLATRFHVSHHAANASGVPALADAVLVALPNHLHSSVAVEFLSQGIHVLVEKPMATSVGDARQMVAAEREGGAVLQIGLMKRFAHGARAIEEALDGGRIGAVSAVSVDWGVEFDWPLASDAGMAPGASGGGVLMDFGSHLLDLLCWWFGEAGPIAYVDDSRGGIEADCALTTSFATGSGEIPCSVRLSRLRRLKNVFRISAERGTIEWAHESPGDVRFIPTAVGGKAPDPWTGIGATGQDLEDLFAEQLRHFVAAVRSGGPSPVSGASALPALELIDRCYAERRTVRYPWEVPVELPRGPDLEAG